MSSRLSAEIKRLYQLPGDEAPLSGASLPLVGDDGRVRALVMALRGPAEWPVLGAVWRGVQSDLDLPAPAIAVNGVDAFELWFSLVEPVPLTQATHFLQALRARYLPDVRPQRVRLRPDAGGDASAHCVAAIPQPQGDAGHWSAFVAPDLAAVFGDEPLLDLPPGLDAQADLLCRLRSIQPGEWAAAVANLQSSAASVEAGGATSSQPPRVPAPNQTPEAAFQDPGQFLRHVMNDASVAMALRIEAAKALLQDPAGNRGAGTP